MTDLKNHTGESDVYQLVHCLILKARLFVEMGRAGRGFTLAMRAVGIAMRCKLCPMLWEGVGVLAAVLGSVGEFDMARRLLDSVIPQVSLPHPTQLILKKHREVVDSFAKLDSGFRRR